MNKLLIKYVGSISVLLLIFMGCDSLVTSESEVDKSAIESVPAAIQAVKDADIQQSLAKVRSATARYHDVDTAEEAGYIQVSPFVPGMGYHYVNPSLLDGNINPMEPEALVYVDNPVDEDKRRLVAVEYLIPYGVLGPETASSEFDDKFPGVDGDKWHKEDEIEFWTLHAWIWYPNPEGVFHPHNSRIGDGH